MRPPNLLTAAADILAGCALAASWSGFTREIDWLLNPDLHRLLIASMALYAGGVVLNDRVDAKLDAVERPERPIPSGVVSNGLATVVATLLFAISLLLTAWIGLPSLIVATGTLLMILTYDLAAKSSARWGPLTMGLCRSGNLLLGGSLFLPQFTELWPFLFIPLLYIASITWISRFEVSGGGQQSGWLAIGGVVSIAVSLGIFGAQFVKSGLEALLFASTLLLFTGATLPPFLRARKSGDANDIRHAVKRGVLSLILLDSLIAASVGAYLTAVVIGTLLPISIWIARPFRVT